MVFDLSLSSASEDMVFPTKITLRSKGKLWLMDSPWIMGILNLTTDSFYSGSRVQTKDQILKLAEMQIRDGADILDLGGYSSRPNAANIEEGHELKRVIPAVEIIRKEFPEIKLSIDTFRSSVAKQAIEAGGDMINDISSGNLDHEMLETIGLLEVPYIAMHMRGNPQTMTRQTEYEDPVLEIMSFFSKKLDECRKSGIKDVIFDPGFGFAKTLDQNYGILRNLEYFKTIGRPILVGLSRKSMIYKKLNIEPENALNGTTALNMVALVKGANLLRVHDVKEAKETVKLYKELYP